jgi:hypothetical protein
MHESDNRMISLRKIERATAPPPTQLLRPPPTQLLRPPPTARAVDTESKTRTTAWNRQRPEECCTCLHPLCGDCWLAPHLVVGGVVPQRHPENFCQSLGGSQPLGGSLLLGGSLPQRRQLAVCGAGGLFSINRVSADPNRLARGRDKYQIRTCERTDINGLAVAKGKWNAGVCLRCMR